MSEEGMAAADAPAPTPADIESALRSAWSAATCDPVDLPDWSPANPARGQCGVTALLVNDLLGGELLCAAVLNADGSRQGVHYWNRLAEGVEIDLTREQFQAGEIVQEPVVVERPPGPPRRCCEQYAEYRARVLAALSLPQARA